MFEHIAVNVADSDAAIEWYTKNLAMRVLRNVPGEKAFLGDASGRPVLEIYANPTAPVLNFEEIHPLSFHIAFAVADPDAKASELVAAGAKIAEPAKESGGDSMIMLTDPFGVAIQLLRRERPL